MNVVGYALSSVHPSPFPQEPPVFQVRISHLARHVRPQQLDILQQFRFGAVPLVRTLKFRQLTAGAGPRVSRRKELPNAHFAQFIAFETIEVAFGLIHRTTIRQRIVETTNPEIDGYGRSPFREASKDVLPKGFLGFLGPHHS